MKIWWCFDNSGPTYGGKGSFFRLSHFFCGKVNVIVCYLGTFFQAMVLKLSTGYLVHITEYVKFFLRFHPFGPELWAKRVFPKMGLSHFSTVFTLMQR